MAVFKQTEFKQALFLVTRNKIQHTQNTTKLRGMGSTLRMRTAISPGQAQPSTTDFPLLGAVSMTSLICSLARGEWV